MRDVVIGGVGIHPFGRFPDDYRRLGAVAAAAALADFGTGLDVVELALVGNVGAEMAKGHNIMEQLARTGKPIINVEAACASRGSAL